MSAPGEAEARRARRSAIAPRPTGHACMAPAVEEVEE